MGIELSTQSRYTSKRSPTSNQPLTHTMPTKTAPDEPQILDETESIQPISIRDEVEEPSLGLRHSDRVFLVTVTLFCGLLAAIIFLSRPYSGFETVEIRHLQPEGFTFQLDINTATWVEWMQLDGVGETTARKIISDRETNGPFSSLTDVQRVNGIGPARIKKMLPNLACASCEE